MDVRHDGKTVEQAVGELQVPYHALSTAYGLLPKAYEKLRPNIDLARKVETEFKRDGIRPLILVGDQQ
ncbi:hypothetical protein COV16_03535 [Candidatus Woesearchaeota archaeon CG10_big_fil_rev_8_21_14_0_10_34_8]|nr:MAG: hypothetical protein COV16_03535 [Candidatus Woesearchaeota archaeon CG10_big_fil_rev_8_21_14_0_10_34_8]